MVRGIGAYSVSSGQVRFVPAVDTTTALAAMFVLAVSAIIRARRRRGA